MPDESGYIIDEFDGGKPTVHASVSNTGGTAGGTFQPEIIGGIDTENPDTVRFNPVDPATGKRKRGRPAGSRNRDSGGTTGSVDGKTAKESVHLSGVKLEDVLFSLHLMGAEFFRTAELAMDKSESKILADAIQEVAKYHNVVFDPKKVAMFNLAAIAGGLYGVRFMAIRARLQNERKVAPTPIRVEPKPATTQPQNGAPNPLYAPPSAAFGDQGAGL